MPLLLVTLHHALSHLGTKPQLLWLLPLLVPHKGQISAILSLHGAPGPPPVDLLVWHFLHKLWTSSCQTLLLPLLWGNPAHISVIDESLPKRGLNQLLKSSVAPFDQSQHHHLCLSVRRLHLPPSDLAISGGSLRYSLDLSYSRGSHLSGNWFPLGGGSPWGKRDFSAWLVWEKEQSLTAQRLSLPSLSWEPCCPLGNPRPMFSESAAPTGRPVGVPGCLRRC